jgi:hypothetical protein
MDGWANGRTLAAGVFCNPKVTNLYYVRASEEDVFGLDVAVNDVYGVHVSKSTCRLPRVPPDLLFVERNALLLPYPVVERATVRVPATRTCHVPSRTFRAHKAGKRQW